MDTDRLEVIGLKPLRDLLKEFGGWPVVEGATWNEDEFDWLVHATGLAVHGVFELWLCSFSDLKERKEKCRTHSFIVLSG